ncbi:MAG: HEAT repeat domain-containing protein [Candidatus Thorarchaeota archaeon]
MFDLISKSDGSKRGEVVEYINGHPEEFTHLLKDVFSRNDIGSLELKQKLLTYGDFISDKLAIEMTQQAIEDTEKQIRILGLQSVYRRQIDSLNHLIAQILDDDQEPFETRKWAIHILGSNDPVGFGKSLRVIARNPFCSAELRKEAIFSLTNIESDETIGVLCALLGDSNPEIRQSSAWVLGKIGSSQSIVCLMAALEDDAEGVRDWAIRGLRDMDDSRALQGLTDAMTRCDPVEQVRMISLVVEKRSEIILRSIAELLESTDVAVRRQAAWAMGVSPYPPAVGVLELLLEDTDEQTKTYAKKALARLGRIDPTDFGFNL